MKSNAPRSNTKIPRGERKRKVVIFYSILRIWEGVTPGRGVIRFFPILAYFLNSFAAVLWNVTHGLRQSMRKECCWFAWTR